MKQQSAYIPVPDLKDLEKGWYFIETNRGHQDHAWYVPEVKRFDCDNGLCYFHYEVKHILEKKELFVLTKEELEKVFEDAWYLGAKSAFERESSEERYAKADFNHWINQQKH